MAVTPSREQIEQLLADSKSKSGEVVMLNLLRYRSSSTDGDGSGADAYGRYAEQVVQMVEKQGGTVLWLGRPDQVLIGDIDGDAWDAVALVRYPNRRAFIEMTSSAEYEKAHEHRESGLDRTVLLAMTPTTSHLASPA